jgi:acyl-coenzyme A thioesterase PaaI-like protein
MPGDNRNQGNDHVDLYTNYHRPIFAGDELIITATVMIKGKTKIHMTAEAYNKGKQIDCNSPFQLYVFKIESLRRMK